MQHLSFSAQPFPVHQETEKQPVKWLQADNVPVPWNGAVNYPIFMVQKKGRGEERPFPTPGHEPKNKWASTQKNLSARLGAVHSWVQDCPENVAPAAHSPGTVLGLGQTNKTRRKPPA